MAKDWLSRIMSIDFLALMFFLVVMLRFSTGEADSEETRIATLAKTESGDTFKQLMYTLLFLLFVFQWFIRKGFKLPRCVGYASILLLGWILLSALWSYEPSISFRRGILLTFVFFSLAIVIDFLGPYRSMDVLYKALAICVLLSLFLVVLVPSIGKHPLTEVDPSIAGGWRGVFVHKNTAGAVIAMAAIVYFHYGISRKRAIDWILFTLAMIFVIGSKAKTPLGLFMLVVPLSIIYRVSWGNFRTKILCSFLALLAIVAVVAGALGYSDVLERVFTDPEAFTGRVAIWESALAFWSDHVWFGAGYSALWAVTAVPPIVAYAKFPFLEFITHSHSGYIEILATTGIPGFVLAVIAAVVTPFIQLMKMSGYRHIQLLSLLFALWFFGVLENFMETQLFTRDREIWIVYFTAILIAQQLAKEAYSSMRSRRSRTAY